MRKLIIVPPLSSDNSHTLFWAEKWTDNGQKRKVYCPHDPSGNLSLTTQHIHKFFKQPEICHCECSEQCIERMCSGLLAYSIVIAGCHQADIFAQQIINLVCGVKLPQLHLDSNQILVIRWHSGSYEITSPPLRPTTIQPYNARLVSQ